MPADKHKTPGEVAFRAHQAAFAQARPGPRLKTWEEFQDDIHTVWEAAAQAVRQQLAQEMKALRFEPGPAIAEALGRIRNIRKVMHKWHAIDHDFDTSWAYDNETLETIAAILGEPTQEAAEACAETADAEQSKSPPPAER